MMPVAEKMIEVPGFELSKPSISTLPVSFGGGQVSENLEYLGTNKPAYKLYVDSLTHADQSALYLLGLLTKMGVDTDAPAKAKQAALQHYEAIHANRGRGNWNFDGVDYDMEAPDKRGGLFLPKGYETVGWIKNPVWKLVDNVYVPVVEGNAELIFPGMPPEGYGPIPTVAGLRDPRTGWALSTSPNRKFVIDELAGYFSKFVDETAAKDLAKKEVSYSYRRQHGAGKAAVYRDFDLGDGGPFGEDAGWDADGRDGGLGAFPFRSSEKQQ